MLCDSSSEGDGLEVGCGLTYKRFVKYGFSKVVVLGRRSLLYQ